MRNYVAKYSRQVNRASTHKNKKAYCRLDGWIEPPKSFLVKSNF